MHHLGADTARRIRAAYARAVDPRRLSGVEHCYVNGRTLAVDDDNFLILNHGQIYSTSIRALQPVESLAICSKPELAEQIYAEASASIEQALVRCDTPAERTPDFMENLHPHENSVSPVLVYELKPTGSALRKAAIAEHRKLAALCERGDARRASAMLVARLDAAQTAMHKARPVQAGKATRERR